MYSKLNEILSDLSIGESIEGVKSFKEVYSDLLNKDVIEIIDSEVFSLTYSKSDKDLKFEFKNCSGTEIDDHIIGSLLVVNNAISEIRKILKDLH